MNKRIISVTVLVTMLLTGCSSSSKNLLQYEDSKSSIATLASNSANRADLFAKDLCVIPKDTKTEEDSKMTSEASLLVNTTTKEMIYGDNVYEKLYPASITKIVTALVTLKYGNLSDTVTISKKAANITESGAKLCGFKEGDTITLESLLNALIVYSGNDAGIAIAEHIAGSEEEFCKLMNQETKKLGAVNSNFVNAHGLHNDKHYTTVYDIYLVFQELIQNETFRKIMNQSSYTCKYKNKDGLDQTLQLASTNRYLLGKAQTDETLSVIGGKTGTTNAAGSCLVLYSTDTSQNEYISVILKAASEEDLYQQMTHLLDKAVSQ